MNLISKTLHFLGKKFYNSSVIQIGAMDGINFDDTRGFMDMYPWKLLLVEPIPDLFEELKINYKNRLNCIFEQVAITEENGEVTMLTIPPEIIEKENLHPGYKGMSALYPLKNGFGSTYQRDIDVKEKFGVNIQVPSCTFSRLLERNNLETFDILICDAEGYDYKIFKQIDLNKHRPKFIRLEYINLEAFEKEEIIHILNKNNYVFEIGQDIDATPFEIWEQVNNGNTSSEEKILKERQETNNNITIVSGLWNISRTGRDFEEHYLPRFKEFLKIPANMILFLPKDLHSMVWEIRDKSNTFVKEFELQHVRNLYDPHWSSTQKIRTSKEWLNMTGEGGWLRSSPQAVNEWYNPIVQSKMFMLHDASIWNTFNTEYFYWLDAGITNTVPISHLVQDNALSKLPEVSNPFLFLSYPYESAGEIHGFDFQAMNGFAGEKVKYVCRGGLFGGHKDQIREASATYYSLLAQTLSRGLMGTEESIFSIMAVREPHLYRRFMLDGNGLIVKFVDALLKDAVELEPIEKLPSNIKPGVSNAKLKSIRTNLYILTFNFPKQVLHTIESMKKVPEWLEKPHLVLLDNSTNEEARNKNREIAKEYNFEYISLEGNKGICGGRQAAAEHFHESDADFYFFFEDDMTINSKKEEGFCRNGFRKHVSNLYEILHKIMLKEEFDFLKLSFTEVYWDNNIQTSWYNVPQNIRTRDWPEYDKLPISGHDPNAPRTKFGTVDKVDGVTYIDGEVTYTNWPMIVSKKGNEKMFIETKWAHPFEQTWMSYMYQKTKEGHLKPGVLLASPILHDRIAHYTPQERREN